MIWILVLVLAGCSSTLLTGEAPTNDCGQPIGYDGCLPGEELCDGTCAWVRGDPNNCGECGYVCGEHGYHAFVCSESRCFCPPDFGCGPVGWVER